MLGGTVVEVVEVDAVVRADVVVVSGTPVVEVVAGEDVDVVLSLTASGLHAATKIARTSAIRLMLEPS